jgi:hypothetical protein
MSTRSLRTIIVGLILALLCAPTLADAKRRTRRTRKARVTRVQKQQQQQLQDKLKALPGATHFVRGGKLHVAVKDGEACNTKLMGLPNTVEFFAKKGYMHLFVRVKDQTYDRHTNVKKVQWDKFSYKKIEQSGVLLQLPKATYDKLVAHLEAANTDSKGTVGTFTMEGGKFPQQSNCTSWVTLAKLGDKKVIEALGVPREAKGIGDANPTRHPQSLINALIDHSPFTKAVIMRNHDKTSAEEAKIDFTVGSRALVR